MKKVLVRPDSIRINPNGEYLAHCANIARIIAHADGEHMASKRIERYMRVVGLTKTDD